MQNRTNELYRSASELNLDYEGWLIKKGKKRYFVLSNNTLMWFDRPKGTPKGSLPVKEYSVQIRDGSNSKKEVVLIPQGEKKDMKTYVLEGEKSDQDVVDWAKAIKKVLRHERDDDEEPSKLGWLEKKGQKRWFILKEGKLYWFNKEQLWSPDAAITANGSLDMSECSVTDGPEAKQKGNSTNFNFTVKNSKDTYILTAKTEQEKIEWIDILKDSIRFTKRAAKDRRRTAAFNKNVIPEKKGFLTKKGQKRFFVLKDCILRWYLDASEKDERGNLPLLGCTVTFNNEKLEVQIKNKGTHYELYAQSFQEADEWFFMLELAAERAPELLEGKTLNPRDSVRVERNSLPPESSQARGSPRGADSARNSPRRSVPVDSSIVTRSPSQEQSNSEPTPAKSPEPVRAKTPEEKKNSNPFEEEKKNSNPFEEEEKKGPNPFSDDDEDEPVVEPEPVKPSKHEQRQESPAPVHQTPPPVQQTPPQQQSRKESPTLSSSNGAAASPQLEKHVKELEMKLKEVTTQKDSLEKELKNALSTKESLAQTNKSLEKQKNKLEQEVQELKEKLEKEQEEVDTLQDKLVAKEKAVRRRWRPDYEVDECTFCKSAFGVFLRRHHCRHCGEIFCASCSSKQLPLSSKHPELVRVCDTCYEAAN